MGKFGSTVWRRAKVEKVVHCEIIQLEADFSKSMVVSPHERYMALRLYWNGVTSLL